MKCHQSQQTLKMKKWKSRSVCPYGYQNVSTWISHYYGHEMRYPLNELEKRTFAVIELIIIVTVQLILAVVSKAVAQ